MVAAGHAEAGVVHQHINRQRPCLQFAADGGDGVGLGQIRGDADDIDAMAIAQVRRQGSEPVQTPRGQHQRTAARGKCFGEGLTDTG